MTFTSTTPDANVSDLTTPAVSVVSGQPGSSSPGVTETAALTFSNLAAGQSVSLAGLTFTATSNISANQVASAFANLTNGATTGTGAGLGSYSGTLSNWNTGGASGAGVTFTSTTPDANVSDLTASTSEAINHDATDGSQILDFQSGAFSKAYLRIKTINIRTDSGGSNPLMQELNSKFFELIEVLRTDNNDKSDNGFLNLQSALTQAIDYISKERTTFGSQLNQSSFIVSNLQSQSANFQSSDSAIVDIDFALETSKMLKGQILEQSSTAVLAQANQIPNVVISLLSKSFTSNYDIGNFVY